MELAPKNEQPRDTQEVVEALISVTRQAFEKVTIPAPVHPAGILAASILLEDLIQLGPHKRMLTPKLLRETVKTTAAIPEVASQYDLQLTNKQRNYKVAENIDFLINQRYLCVFRRPGKKRPNGNRRQNTYVSPTPEGRDWLMKYVKPVA